MQRGDIPRKRGDQETGMYKPEETMSKELTVTHASWEKHGGLAGHGHEERAEEKCVLETPPMHEQDLLPLALES